MPLPVIAAGLGPLISSVILTLVRIYAVQMIGKILLTVGVGLFAYNYAVPEINNWIASKFHALPDFVRASAGAAGLDVFVTMVVSAMSVKAVARLFFGKRSSP